MPLVRTIQCPRCGGRTKIPRGANEAACLHCGTSVPLSLALQREQQWAHQFPPMTPLRLGMKGRYRGEDWEIAGRQVCRQVDDGEVYTWEEYLLVTADGGLLFLEYDEGKWKVSEAFVPDHVYSPVELSGFRAGSRINLDGTHRLVSDSGAYQIVFAEGDFPWMIVPERPVHFLDASFGNQFHCIEWSPEEVEFYRGQFVDERQIFIAFNLHHLVAALERRALLLKSRQRFGLWCLGLSLVCGIFWIASFGGGNLAPNGTGRTETQQITAEGTRFGPINLTKVGKIHRLELNADLRERSVWMQAVVEDDTEQELMTTERDMWDESGTDSDGYWHESDLHANTHFVLRKPGNYFVRIYAEPEAANSMNASLGSASFKLYEDVHYGVWTGICALLLLLTGCGFLAAGSPSTLHKVWTSVKESSDD